MSQKAKGVKESAKDKKQRRKEFQQMQKQIYTIVLPTLAAVAVFIVAYIYFRTRPVDYL